MLPRSISIEYMPRWQKGNHERLHFSNMVDTTIQRYTCPLKVVRHFKTRLK